MQSFRELAGFPFGGYLAGVRLVGGGGSIPAELLTLRDGLVEHYALDEASGTRVGSVAGYDLTDVNGNMVGVGGKTGARAALGATNKYLRQQTTDLRMSGSFTIVAWVGLDGVVGDIMARWTNSNEWLLYMAVPNGFDHAEIRFTLNFANAQNIAANASTAYPYTLRAWHMIAAWWDSVADTINIQIDNGAIDSVSTAAGSTPVSSSAYTTVGYGGAAYANNNRIDSISVYNRVLTADERTAHWNSGDGLAYPFTSLGDHSLNWVCDGDSMTDGTSYVISAMRWQDQVSALLGGGKYNDPTLVAVNAKSIATLLADGAANVDSLYDAAKTNLVSIWAGTNDIAVVGMTVADAQADYQAYCEDRQAAGWQVVAFTILPRNTGSYGGNQTQFNNNRAAFNAWLRANYTSFADALVDVALDSSIGVSNTAYTDTVYFLGDQIHLNPVGQAVVAGLAATAIDSIT